MDCCEVHAEQEAAGHLERPIRDRRANVYVALVDRVQKSYFIVIDPPKVLQIAAEHQHKGHADSVNKCRHLSVANRILQAYFGELTLIARSIPYLR